jgi:lysophospholipase L1-like esterase
VQADIFTGETRRLIANWLSDQNPSRGFTFPYQLAATNNPFDFEITSDIRWLRQRIVDTPSPANLGVTGIALFTMENKGTLTIRLKKSLSVAENFDLVKVYYENDLTNIVFEPQSEGEVVAHSDGLWIYRLDSPAESFSFQFSQKSGGNGFRFYGMELLNSDSKFVYHAVGVNGAEVRTYLLSQNIEKLMQQIDPQMVILSLGTNDAYNSAFNAQIFGRNLREFVSRIRNANPNIMVILATPGDHLLKNRNENPTIESVQNEIYRVAQEQNCGVWDFYHIMGGAGSIRYWAQHGLCAPDFLHLNRSGYRLQGTLLFSALVELSGYEHLSENVNELANK